MKHFAHKSSHTTDCNMFLFYPIKTCVKITFSQVPDKSKRIDVSNFV